MPEKNKFSKREGEKLNIQSSKKENRLELRNSIVGNVLALHTTDVGLILTTSYGPLSPLGVTLE